MRVSYQEGLIDVEIVKKKGKYQAFVKGPLGNDCCTFSTEALAYDFILRELALQMLRLNESAKKLNTIKRALE